MKSNKNFYSLTLNIFLVFIFFQSCDFSSLVSKDIVRVQELMANQDYEKAAYEYEKLLTKNPPSDVRLKILFQLGNIYSLYLNRPKLAESYFEQVSSETHGPLWQIQAQEKIGEINFSLLKNFKKSQIVYTYLINIRPKLEKHDFYQTRLSLSYLENKDYENAEDILLQITKMPDHLFHARSFFYLGLNYFNQKKWSKAVSYFKEYLKRENPEKSNYVVETKYLMANAFETMEKLRSAYDIYYSIQGGYPNPEVLKKRLESLYQRRVSRKR